MSNELRIKNLGIGIIEFVFFFLGKFELKIIFIEVVFLFFYENVCYFFIFYNFFEFFLYFCCGNVCYDVVFIFLFWVILVNVFR